LAAEPKRRLGRGLEALLRAYPEPEQTSDAEPMPDVTRRKVPVELIERNPRNPRRDFRKDDLDELAASLKQHGVVQPIVVRRREGRDERYEIIAGERRWRAAQQAGLHDVPVTILDVSDRQALELAIVENVQRADLNPIEEARGYQALIAEFDYSQGDLGDVIGKSRVHVTNTLRLLKLPEAVLNMIESGALTAGHGRALLTAHDPLKLARLILSKNLSVRDAERLAQAPEAATTQRAARKKAKTTDVAALEKELTDRLGMKVEIVDAGEGRGEVQILYRSLEQLDLICRRLRSDGRLNGERKTPAL
jgi:ParB family transcriptional regulator, chromosome partitioning protein